MLPNPRQGLIRFEGEFYAEDCHAVSSIDDYRLAMGGNGAGIYNGSGGQIVFKQAVEMLFCGNWVSTGTRDVCVLARLNFAWPCCSTTACGILRMFARGSNQAWLCWRFGEPRSLADGVFRP